MRRPTKWCHCKGNCQFSRGCRFQRRELEQPRCYHSEPPGPGGRGRHPGLPLCPFHVQSVSMDREKQYSKNKNSSPKFSAKKIFSVPFVMSFYLCVFLFEASPRERCLFLSAHPFISLSHPCISQFDSPNNYAAITSPFWPAPMGRSTPVKSVQT